MTTLTEALNEILDRTAISAFTCEELQKAAAPRIGHEPSLMAVSRIMGTRAGWEKARANGKVIFSKVPIVAQRIHIEDAEDNFLYLDVDLPRDEIEPLLEAINRYSNGKARIEPLTFEH